MKLRTRSPLSFLFFCISMGLLALSIVPASFMRSSETPGWLGGIMFFMALIGILLIPVSLIVSFFYRTEIPKYRLRNRIALWGSVALIMTVWALIIFVGQESRGAAFL